MSMKRTAVLISAVLGLAGCSAHTVTTGQASPSSSGTSASASSTPSPAHVGTSITLTGNNDGEKMDVKVVKIVSHAQPADQFSSPDAGKRFLAVQFRLTDTGTKAYSDSPSNGAAVVDADGQSYDSSIYDVTGCQSFPGTENIAVGRSGIGCVVFQVPNGAKITEVQFTLDSGFASQTGQWKA